MHQVVHPLLKVEDALFEKGMLECVPMLPEDSYHLQWQLILLPMKKKICKGKQEDTG